jgi:hypothetical protein
MIALLVSYVCDYCERPPALEHLYRGWVVWRPDRTGARDYVFPDRESAERWRSLRGPTDAEIRQVLCPQPFRWRQSAGSLRDIQLADRLYEIFPDHRFQPARDRAFLAPA